MSEKTFELGLVGAGAISAGAYTAGVIDFLIQALDAWYLSKAIDRNVPQHDIKLSVISGASAGAITAALAAAYIGSHQNPIATEEEGNGLAGRQNKLFDSWVNRIDIEQLLETKDLEQGGNVLSLLDSSVLWDIANSGLDVTPREERRPYIPENFDLLMTVTNLRGVPYGFQVIGDQPTDYDMSLHADHVHFHLSDTGNNEEKYRYGMRWHDFGSSQAIKEKLKMAALASGAFPVGLAPRILNHEIVPKVSDYYSARQWPIPTPYSVNPHLCTTMEEIEVKWGEEALFDYQFQCVDGGVMNNEPLELARRILAGDSGRNDRRGELAKKAVLLIDPFPNHSPFEPKKYEPASDLFKAVMKLFGALKNQARFKPDELELARNPDVYSRFMIAPKRSGPKGEFFPIACGLLDGFGGFLSRKFRSHDFFLGRRNTQKFLRDHLVLPENNSLFDDWTEDMRKSYCVKNKAGAVIKDSQRLLPIIPLVDSVDLEFAPCFEPQWPLYIYDDLNILTKQIENRVDVVFDRLVAQYFQSNNPIVRFIAIIIIGRKKNDTVEYVRQVIKDDLIRMELIEEVK